LLTSLLTTIITRISFDYGISVIDQSNEQ